MTSKGAASDRGTVSRFGAHPAILLALTAVLTGLLVPWITSRWEKRDRAVEIRRLETRRNSRWSPPS
jgi:hypothetical protein